MHSRPQLHGACEEPLIINLDLFRYRPILNSQRQLLFLESRECAHDNIAVMTEEHLACRNLAQVSDSGVVHLAAHDDRAQKCAVYRRGGVLPHPSPPLIKPSPASPPPAPPPLSPCAR